MLTNRLVFAFGVFAFASALSAQTVETIPFRAVLSARNETTPVVDSTATGAANIFLHVVRDGSGKIVSGSVDFTVSYKFAGAVSLTAMLLGFGGMMILNVIRIFG